MKKAAKNISAIADFIYEVGILSRTPRSGLWFLGDGEQSVAEHLLRTAFIAYCLCELNPRANKEKVIMMALVHDLGEARTSDLNYVHQRYGRLAETQAFTDLAKEIPFGTKFKKLYEEEQGKVTIESKLVRDADQLEWMATLREQEIKGNTKAKIWARIAYQRLKTKEGKRVGAILLKIHPDNWWFSAKDKWFVGRSKRHQAWKSAMRHQ